MKSVLADADEPGSMSKDEHERLLPELRVELLNHQFDLKSADFSVVIFLSGNHRAGTVDALQALHEWMDARLIEHHAMFGKASRSDRRRPWSWRYWSRLPRRGRIGIFLGAWPLEFVGRRLKGDWDESEFEAAIEDVTRFERLLIENGTLILKIWLHLPKDVLSERLKASKGNLATEWRFDKIDWNILEHYKKGLDYTEQLLAQSHSELAPWHVLNSEDARSRDFEVAKLIASALAERFAVGVPGPARRLEDPPVIPDHPMLQELDLAQVHEGDDYDAELLELQARVNKLVRRAYKAKLATVIALEGVDAAGKGGAIRRLVKTMPIEIVRVIPISAPTEEEKAHPYLWRFHQHLPESGHVRVFDRSWYGRVLVERVEGYADELEWRRAYREINDFESLLDRNGVLVLKFWLAISADEQEERFRARAQTPYKKYKLTAEDERNRKRWSEYVEAAQGMFRSTSTPRAPWHLVAANDKKHARITILRTFCEQLEKRLRE